MAIDTAKIEQVLNNLISNAIEHSPADSTVRIRIVAADKEMTVRVEDAGPGIPAKEQEILFKPFVRGGAVKSAGSKSTGLGLAISKKIVAAHGGTIWIEDNSGKGAVFAFCIPINRKGQNK